MPPLCSSLSAITMPTATRGHIPTNGRAALANYPEIWVRELRERQQRTHSDLDLVVEYVPGHGGFAFVEFCEKVEELLGRRVDVITEKSLHPIVRDRILSQALPL